MSLRRIAVVTDEALTRRLAGPAIRAWQMTAVLSRDHEVALFSTGACSLSSDRFEVSTLVPDRVPRLLAECDAIVFQGGLLRGYPEIRDSDAVIVADVYDPYHLETLEQSRYEPMVQREATTSHLTDSLNEQLLRADFLLCANSRQRDFWLGSLAALGRVNPRTYDDDDTLQSLIAVVPFGVPHDPPERVGPAMRGVVPGIGRDDRIVLWGGGVYDWFDPLTLVRAVDRLRLRLPDVRLFFLGMRHPNPNIPPMRVATELRALSADLGLTGKHVFFNESWVDYDRRADYLLEADCGVSTHLDHLETAFSFRTRVLDYLWAGLPIVATAGDDFSELIERHGLGATVPPRDVEALESALGDVLARPPDRAHVSRVAERFRWETVLAPLVDFCRSPHPAPDRRDRDMGPKPPAPRVSARRLGAAMRAVRRSR